MNDENVNVTPAEELDASGFSVIGNDAISSEKIIAPRYSYWRSVFRVFFRNKGNIFLIALFVLMITSAIFVPLICKYDPYENITDSTVYNLSPAKAMAKFGHTFKWHADHHDDGLTRLEIISRLANLHLFPNALDQKLLTFHGLL